MFERMNLRAIGVLGCLISTAMFMLGGLTDHWMNSDNGHFGLWEICDNTKHNVTANATKNATTGAQFGNEFGMLTTTLKYEDEKDKEKKKDDDDSCTAFGITSLPVFLHIVRGIMVLTGLVLAWGVLSSRSLQLKVPRGDTFFDSHKSEVLGFIACTFAWIAVRVFEDNYKTVREDKFTNSRIGWSCTSTRLSLYVYFFSAVFMMSPSLYKKYDDCSLSRLCVKSHRRSRRSGLGIDCCCFSIPPCTSSPDTNGGNSNEITLGYEGPVNAHVYEIEGGLAPDHSFQLSETDSDIFTVIIGDSGGNGQPSDGSDLPQYEDVARSGGGGGDVGLSVIPPPPSYDEVLSGGYLTFSHTTPSAPQARNLPITESESGSHYVTSSAVPPPPAYQFNDSNV